VTSEGSADDQYDFVCRVFGPWYGIAEDPVTGSAYSVLAPFWAPKLNKEKGLFAKQCSKRGGELWMDIHENGLRVKGNASIVLRGNIDIHNFK